MATAMKEMPAPRKPETTGSRKKPKLEKTEAAQIEIVDLDAFCLTPISPKGTSKKNAISVEQDSENRDIQLASLFKSLSNKVNFIDLEDGQEYYSGDDDDDVKLLNFKPLGTSFGKRRKPFFNPSESETGQSSNSQKLEFLCDICVEPKTTQDWFRIKGCSHAYCRDCVIKYVAYKLQDNITGIGCPVPECGGLLEPEYCRSILPKEVFDRWGNALCEAVILGSQKFYCPYKDCSALMIDDGKEIIRESKCLNCRRKICAHCKVIWHVGIECEEFQKLHKDERDREDLMLMKLAKNRRWKRCPACKFFVARNKGCSHMNCRCGTGFCYKCGDVWTWDHYCKKGGMRI
ncbi:E3 ubiquitin-protein ligase [Tripterygium wilfordii]|uniref:RBR-type E3 ubiquitin transferase n=1 Tax=Tripterygium wilfordii TaxID=458696 RepID=A0A7J7CFJ1_TRIWF|nr:ATP-dependent RNA helicase DEAH12, chloroplastic-like [Tripterygium wilfordii]KAF5732903.1 E3 ubiquitin-protein ligase [Tripterygium wilfordii]